MLRVQLPDRRTLDCKVDFSIKTFNAVVQLCKELGKYLAICATATGLLSVSLGFSEPGFLRVSPENKHM